MVPSLFRYGAAHPRFGKQTICASSCSVVMHYCHGCWARIWTASLQDTWVLKPWKMHLQRGNGEYIPHVLLHKGQSQAQLSNGLKIEVVEYLPSMHACMEAADLIISHAGSGSLFEALSLGKPVIAVPNAILMANHQVTCSACTSLPAAQLVQPFPLTLLFLPHGSLGTPERDTCMRRFHEMAI